MPNSFATLPRSTDTFSAIPDTAFAQDELRLQRVDTSDDSFVVVTSVNSLGNHVAAVVRRGFNSAQLSEQIASLRIGGSDTEIPQYPNSLRFDGNKIIYLAGPFQAFYLSLANSEDLADKNAALVERVTVFSRALFDRNLMVRSPHKTRRGVLKSLSAELKPYLADFGLCLIDAQLYWEDIKAADNSLPDDDEYSFG